MTGIGPGGTPAGANDDWYRFFPPRRYFEGGKGLFVYARRA